jgi:hypothetical protein
MHINLTSETNTFVWGLTKSGKYAVKSMYLDIINEDTKFLRRYIWKMKVPLKIKKFMWFVHRKEILTKDNLKERNWDGDTKCCFCDDEESVNHIFIECPFAKIVWHIIHMSFGLAPPKNIKNLFGNWLTGIPKQDLVNIRVGVCAVLWALWNTRNDVMFNKQKKTYLYAGYPHDYPLDLFVVLSSARGEEGRHGFWVQPYGDGHSGFIQPVRLSIAF